MATADRFDSLVHRVLAALAPVQRHGVAAIIAWVADVARWRRKLDLTAARSDEQLVDLLVADAALLACAVLGRGETVGAQLVDVGSGAGAPGLPLALLRPDLRVTLVEPLQKRAALLRLTVGRLAPQQRAKLWVEQAHAESLPGRFEVALSRATLPPPSWLELGARLAPAGEVWVLLAGNEPPVLPGWRVGDERRYCWPLTGVERTALCYHPVR